MVFSDDINSRLTHAYEEMMWLAARPYVGPRRARAWYSQVMAGTLNRKVRRFTGLVSQAAILEPDGSLVLEHEGRLAFSLSALIEQHVKKNIHNPYAFIELVADVERVNITSDTENHAARRAQGNYKEAGIYLKRWDTISPEVRLILWKRKLKGKVANANDFAV